MERSTATFATECTCMSQRPGIRKRPAPSTTSELAGHGNLAGRADGRDAVAGYEDGLAWPKPAVPNVDDDDVADRERGRLRLCAANAEQV
jgi:hypothetical protein